jgi:hypothetical protein
MAQDRNPGPADRGLPNIFAHQVGKESIGAVVGAALAPSGPWSYVNGIPNPGSDMLGSPPQYLAVAAWAA